jgi:hypothetical protein
MYINNKIYKNTLSTYTRKEKNAWIIAEEANRKKNNVKVAYKHEKPHSTFGTRYQHFHPGTKNSHLSSHSFYNNPIF